MIRPWHRRCIGVSKPPRVEQPVVPAVRKPFSNNNENNIWWDRVRTCVCTFVNRKTPFPFNSKIIFGSRIKIIVKLNPFYLSTSVPFTSEKCHEFPKFHFKKTSFLFLFIKDSLKNVTIFESIPSHLACLNVIPSEVPLAKAIKSKRHAFPTPRCQGSPF